MSYNPKAQTDPGKQVKKKKKTELRTFIGESEIRLDFFAEKVDTAYRTNTKETTVPYRTMLSISRIPFTHMIPRKSFTVPINHF